MRKLTKIIAVTVVALFGAGAVFLASWEMPPRSANVEKVIPHHRFTR